MAKRYVVLCMSVLILISTFAVWMTAQDRDQGGGDSVIRVVVAMVQLNVAVIDNKGNYVTNLRPSDFLISEDGIRQNIATFEEGNGGPQNVLDADQDDKAPTSQPVAEAPKAPSPASPAAAHVDGATVGGAQIGFFGGNRLHGERSQRFHSI